MTDVLFTKNNSGIATITLNRPEIHNAFDDALIQNLLTILKTINTDDSIKLVQLKSNGKNFSAGADLNWMQRMANYSFAENKQDALILSELMYTLKFLTKPTIASVQGAVLGGGVGLVACCDIAIAAETASFCLSEVKLGLIPAVISPYVIDAIGERAARYYFFTAETMTATTACELGLIKQITISDQLDNTVDKISATILRNSPRAVMAAKELINRVTTSSFDQNLLEKNADAIAKIRVSEEGQEGLTAFLEKRKPKWLVE